MASAAPSGVSEAGTSAGASAAGSSVFFSAFFLVVVAEPFDSADTSLRASLKMSSLERLGSLTLRVPSAPGRPLNFCQSPVTLRIASTASEGCAPTPSQYWARSEVTSMREGSSFGWYLPISSSTLPSRFLRESTTTMRYCGTRILPRRFKRILTATFVVSPQELSWVRDRSQVGSPVLVLRRALRARMRGSGHAGHEGRVCQTVAALDQSGAVEGRAQAQPASSPMNERTASAPVTRIGSASRTNVSGVRTSPWLSASSPSRRLIRLTAVGR